MGDKISSMMFQGATEVGRVVEVRKRSCIAHFKYGDVSLPLKWDGGGVVKFPYHFHFGSGK